MISIMCEALVQEGRINREYKHIGLNVLTFIVGRNTDSFIRVISFQVLMWS